MRAFLESALKNYTDTFKKISQTNFFKILLRSLSFFLIAVKDKAIAHL